GKVAVAQNALKHGLFAVQDVLTTENQAGFDLLREQMLAELAPVGVVESLLAQWAVSLAWRLKRAERMQAEEEVNLKKQSQSVPDPEELTDFVKRTYGDPLPLWVQRSLR
ncbi:MAG: hypothetical protein JSW66_15985, partial [Phycisphaerales bacterium]